MDKTRIFRKLKTKAASFGFSKEELMSVAAIIADKIDSEDASDEDIDAEIDAVLPYLKVGQQQAQRVIKANKPTPTTNGDEDDDEDDDTPPATTPKNRKTKGNEDEPAWFKTFREHQEARMAKLEGDKVLSTRKSRLEALLKYSGDFGKRELKRFSRMNFDSEEAFEEYISEVEEDLEDHKQDEGDEVLATVTKPVGGTGKKGKPEIATDAEIDALVDNM